LEDVGKSSSNELSRVTVTGLVAAAKIYIWPMASAGSLKHFSILEYS